MLEMEPQPAVSTFKTYEAAYFCDYMWTNKVSLSLHSSDKIWDSWNHLYPEKSAAYSGTLGRMDERL